MGGWSRVAGRGKENAELLKNKGEAGRKVERNSTNRRLSYHHETLLAILRWWSLGVIESCWENQPIVGGRDG